MSISAKTKICCIIGNPVEHSLSPVMHNAGYKALGLDYVYVAFRVENIQKAIDGLRALNVRGIVVTVPHKIDVLRYVDSVDETAKKIGAVNTIVNDNGVLTGSNTDWNGSVGALKHVTSITNKTVAVFGAGGAARAVVYGLKREGATVFVFNRTIEKAKILSEEFNLDGGFSLHEKSKIQGADIVINTTSVGMHPLENEIPIPINYLNKQQVVYDIVYTPKETRFLQLAKNQGARVVYGDTMVLYTAIPQFELFTGVKAPTDVMRSALENAAKERK
ncbi:MAG: shikimate dehydrogenase [Candidatus Levybacteria bacterium]|nr:shikimate dehydrogenase [Candidatus Levybacteria bacterium]